MSSGIGAALARAYLDSGQTVYGLSRRTPPELGQSPRFAFRSIDLAHHHDIPGNIDALIAGVDRLDLVVLNAGVMPAVADMADTPLAELKRVMDVNVWANKVLLDSVFAGGRVVTQVVAMSSGAAVSGTRGWNGYSMSKAALNMMIKLYSRERAGTHFSALAPGLVDSEMQDRLRDAPDDPRFPGLAGIRQAQATADLKPAPLAARQLVAAFDRVRKLDSGIFVDLRALAT